MPQLRLGLSHEFLNRNDGWPGLQRAYGLPQSPSGLDHGLAYEALAGGQIDVMDIYSTDAKIAKYKLRVLQDDKHYFPEYAAVLVYRLDVPKRFPAAWAALQKLQGRISADAMVRDERAGGAGEQRLSGDCGRVSARKRSPMAKAAQQSTGGFWAAIVRRRFLAAHVAASAAGVRFARGRDRRRHSARRLGRALAARCAAGVSPRSV